MVGLQAERHLRVAADQVDSIEGVIDHAAAEPAIIELVELVAVYGVVEEEGEIRVEVELVGASVDRSPGYAVGSGSLKVRGQAVALGVAAHGGIDEAEPVDQPAVDGASRAPGRSHPSSSRSP